MPLPRRFDPPRKWFHQMILTISDTLVLASKTPFHLGPMGERVPSSSDGGFFSYRGKVECSGSSRRLLLEEVSCTYCFLNQRIDASGFQWPVTRRDTLGLQWSQSELVVGDRKARRLPDSMALSSCRIRFDSLQIRKVDSVGNASLANLALADLERSGFLEWTGHPLRFWTFRSGRGPDWRPDRLRFPARSCLIATNSDTYRELVRPGSPPVHGLQIPMTVEFLREAWIWVTETWDPISTGKDRHAWFVYDRTASGWAFRGLRHCEGPCGP